VLINYLKSFIKSDIRYLFTICLYDSPYLVFSYCTFDNVVVNFKLIKFTPLEISRANECLLDTKTNTITRDINAVFATAGMHVPLRDYQLRVINHILTRLSLHSIFINSWLYITRLYITDYILLEIERKGQFSTRVCERYFITAPMTKKNCAR